MEKLTHLFFTVANVVLAGVFLWMVIDGQKTTGWANAGRMMAGLAGLLLLLYLYNRKDK
ncbi:DUF6903 family protein [Alkalispirochaeta sphaeroplastigenens]|nr:hypothetical protein [Alkalispirochaeta sphaeroplastigenens]